ncbi:MAG: hypothetical protein NTU79_00340 [Planctomycetota bacterium]|nr:hypothetical protein [Planctomycetota bacterium]
MKKTSKSNAGQANRKPVKKASRTKASTSAKPKSTKKVAKAKATTPKPTTSVSQTQRRTKTVKVSAKGLKKSDSMPSMTFATTPIVQGKAYEPGMPFRLERLITPVEVGFEYAARKKELDAEFDRARKALKKLRSKLNKRKDLENITGTSVRFRTKFGQVVSPLQVAIVINLERKRSLEYLASRKLEKFEAIDGVPVKVVEGSFSLINESASFLRGLSSPITPVSFTEPIVGGAAISPPGNPSAFGTLGLVAVSDDKKTFGISCQHVVSNAVEQIAANGNTRTVGSVKASRPPEKDFEIAVKESLDCSLIELVSNVGQTVKFPSSGAWAHGITGDIYLAGRRVNSNDKAVIDVYKFGVGLGELVLGRIEDDLRDVSINGVPYFNNFSVVHKEDTGRTFALPGDSGSVLFVQGTVKGKKAHIAIGILFARLDGETGTKVGIACNMSYVVKALQLESKIKGLKVAKDWDYE